MKLNSLGILAAACCLAGCGASTSSTSSPAPPHTGITGNWQLTLTSTTGGGATGGTATYGTYLTQAGNVVSGIIGVQQAYPLCVPPTGPPCYFPFGAIPLDIVGTVDPTGNIALSSVPYSGAAGVFSVAASTTDDTTLSGTYSITLVTTTGTWTDQGIISGTTIDALNGTYSGTVKSSTGLSMSVTTTLSQTGSLDPNGYLELSASAAFTGLPCFASATAQVPGILLGNQLVVNVVPANSPATTIGMFGTLSPDAKTIAASFEELSGGTCASGYYYGQLGTGTLTRQ